MMMGSETCRRLRGGGATLDEARSEAVARPPWMGAISVDRLAMGSFRLAAAAALSPAPTGTAGALADMPGNASPPARGAVGGGRMGSFTRRDASPMLKSKLSSEVLAGSAGFAAAPGTPAKGSAGGGLGG